MSRLEELIQQYCPNGVKYYKLDGENGIARIVGGKDYKHLGKGNVPIYGSGGIMGYCDTAIYDRPTVLIPRKGSIANIFYVDCPFWNVDTIFYTAINENIVIPKFLYYYVSNYHVENLNTSNAARPALTREVLKDIEIPVPPLPIQEEIVRILDKFTELEQELEQELELRKKQYEYYRDKMLSLSDYDGEVEWKSLDEIATNWFRGNGIKRDEVIDDGKPCVRYGELYTTYGLHFTDCVSHTSADVLPNPKIAKKGTILFAITGESVEDIAMSTAYLGEEDIYVGGDILAMEHEQDAKYLSYALSTTDARKQKSKGRIKSKVVHSNKNDISQIIIPVPKDINEQKRIADVLDRFYNLINDMNEGLPAEIKMRHQQYEYYRDKLLNFKRLEVA